MSDQRLQPFSYDEFRAIYSKVPRLTVEVVVVLNDGVVLVRREEQSWQNLWHIPGGTVHYQEHLTESVARIAQEELGLTVEIQKLLGYIEYPSEVRERGFGWSVGVAFLCQPKSTINEQSWQKKGIQVFTEIPSNLIEEQRQILELALSAQSLT